jgi:2-phosphosulfolactate phosphatase
MSVYAQAPYTVRCAWGLDGLSALLPESDAIVIVDVLSFTTCVDIAVERGGVVFPFAYRDARATAYAEQKNALLAQHDRNADGFTLSPTSLTTLPTGTRLVLPSPNGSTLSTATGTVPTYAACLRNAKAVAEAVKPIDGMVSIIAAGERWRPQNTLRPALEDLLGAGAVIAHLDGDKSPEAVAAEVTFRQFADDLAGCLRGIGSGRELVEEGFGEDVDLAAQLNISTAVPRLMDGAYQAG